MLAKRCYYDGVAMRSRLEARWALFFDLMQIEWVYEDESYVLQNGEMYLPDFWLPYFNGGTFAECKGEIKPQEIKKCSMLCEGTGNNVLMLVGYPSYLPIEYFVRTDIGVELFEGFPNGNNARDRMFADDAPLFDRIYRAAIEIARDYKFEKWDAERMKNIINQFKINYHAQPRYNQMR